MRQLGVFKLLLMLLSGLVLMFIIAPVLRMAFSTSANDLFNSASDTEVTDSIFLSLWVAFISTLVFSFAAIPVAWFLARSQFKLKALVLGLIDIPVVIPHTAAGIAVLGIVNRDTTIGKLASGLGIEFIGTSWGIAIAMAFVSLPFLINSAIDGFSLVPERLEKTAYSLGASPFRVFVTISLPLAWRSVVSGLVLMFARGMSEFGAVVIIAYHPMTAPVLIFERFGAFGLRYTQPAAVLFVAVCLFVFILLRLLVPRKRSER
jgi:molybdate/tungstate transport system permease protein